MTARMLVAGVGIIFHGDDGFGTAVVTWLEPHQGVTWPAWVVLRDFGIRGVHLAYELLDGYDDVVLVDTMHRDQPAGTVYVVEPSLAQIAAAGASPMDAHDLAPESVLAMVPGLGGTLGRVTVVGCEPVTLAGGIGLDPLVEARVPRAAALVAGLVDDVVSRAASEVDARIGAAREG